MYHPWVQMTSPHVMPAFFDARRDALDVAIGYVERHKVRDDAVAPLSDRSMASIRGADAAR